MLPRNKFLSLLSLLRSVCAVRSISAQIQILYMFRSSIKAGFRNFWKNKSYSLLNILGLAIGIACAGLIFLWVEDETSFDRVHIKKDRIYMVLNNWPFSQHFSTYESTPGL